MNNIPWQITVIKDEEGESIMIYKSLDPNTVNFIYDIGRLSEILEVFELRFKEFLPAIINTNTTIFFLCMELGLINLLEVGEVTSLFTKGNNFDEFLLFFKECCK